MKASEPPIRSYTIIDTAGYERGVFRKAAPVRRETPFESHMRTRHRGLENIDVAIAHIPGKLSVMPTQITGPETKGHDSLSPDEYTDFRMTGLLPREFEDDQARLDNMKTYGVGFPD